MKPSWRLKIGASLGIILFVLLDLFFKRYVYANHTIPILLWKTPLGIDFYLDCVTNKGAAWGMLASLHEPLLWFRIFVIGVLVSYLWLFSKTSVMVGALAAIIAGAVSNVVDCFYFGHVIDMLHFIFWGRSFGIFNLADTAIFLGTMGLIVHLVYTKKGKDGRESNQSC